MAFHASQHLPTALRVAITAHPHASNFVIENACCIELGLGRWPFFHPEPPMKLSSLSPLKFNDSSLYARLDAGVEAACFFNPPGVLHPPELDLRDSPVPSEMFSWAWPLIEIARRYDVTFVLDTDALEQYLAAAPEVLRRQIHPTPLAAHTTLNGRTTLEGSARVHAATQGIERWLVIDSAPQRQSSNSDNVLSCEPMTGLSEPRLATAAFLWSKTFACPLYEEQSVSLAELVA